MDTALAAFRTSTGIVGTWTSCFSAAAGGPLFSVHGSKGSLEIHYAHALLRPRSGKERSFRTHADSYALQFSHFAKALRCAQTPAYTAEDAVADLAVIEGIIRGRVVRP
jgi:predicted dehydrogenase